MGSVDSLDDRRKGPAAFPLLTEGKRSNGFTPRLDTVGLSFRIGPDVEYTGGQVTIHKYGCPDQAFSVRHALPGGGFLALGKGERAWIEASAKRADPDGVSGGSNVVGLTIPQALESMREAYREAGRFCAPREEGLRFELSNVVRLDPVRDFDGVAHIGEQLDGLAGIPRDTRWKSRRWSDAERNKAETLRVGPKAWGATLYDKHIETNGVAPIGRLRFEGRLHRPQLTGEWAQDQGVVMRQVADVTAEKVGRLTARTFDRVGYGREVLGRASLAAKVFGAEALKPQERAQLWSFLTAPGYASTMSKPTRLRYRKLAEELGVTMVDIEDQAAPVLVRLDLDSGQQVVRVA